MAYQNPVSNDEINAASEGQTVASAFLETVARLGSRDALRWKDADGSWQTWTWDEYADKVARVAAGYRELGVQPGQRIVLMLGNIPEFHAFDLAAYFCGATAVSIYNSSSAEQVEYLVNDAEAVVAVVEDQRYLDRFLAVRDSLGTLEHLLVLRPSDDTRGAGAKVRSAAELLEHEPLDLAEAVSACEPDQLATLIYTSGTTGPPKGVMLSHRNVQWTVEAVRREIGWADDEYAGIRYVSYLPMAHIFERLVGLYQGANLGYEITCCPDTALLAEYLGATKPNLLVGVPRVYEKVYAKVNALLGADPEKGPKFNEAVEAAIPIVEAMNEGTATQEQIDTYEFLDAVAFKQVRELLGVDELRLAITGAAPIPADILRWFRAIGIPLTEGYGLSETTAAMTVSVDRVKPGTVGRGVPGCEVAIAEDGEVICRGGNVFQGYLNQPEKTAEALDADGWFHTGDIGEIDDEGFLRIVDRKKELIITAGGKNVSPANLEAALKMIPLVGQAAAIGDQRPFVSALVTLDPDTAPAWAAQHGIDETDLAALAEHPEVIAEIDRGLVEVMEQFNNAESVKKVKVLGEEWLPDTDVLTPTSKLKRRGVAQRYADEIEALYT